MSNDYCSYCGAELLSSLLMGARAQIECPACNDSIGFFTWDAFWGSGGNSLNGLVVLGFAWVLVAPMMGGWIFARFGSSSVMLEPA